MYFYKVLVSFQKYISNRIVIYCLFIVFVQVLFLFKLFALLFMVFFRFYNDDEFPTF